MIGYLFISRMKLNNLQYSHCDKCNSSKQVYFISLSNSVVLYFVAVTAYTEDYC